jgi:preprotein translocase subunit YajC
VKDLAGFLPFVLIALVFWFLIVRPQRRRQQELASTQSAIGPGTEVMLGSGIYGTVVSVDDDTLQLEIASGTTVKVARQAVIKVLEQPEAETPGTVEETRESDVDTEPGQSGPGDDRHQ